MPCGLVFGVVRKRDEKRNRLFDLNKPILVQLHLDVFRFSNEGKNEWKTIDNRFNTKYRYIDRRERKWLHLRTHTLTQCSVRCNVPHTYCFNFRPPHKLDHPIKWIQHSFEHLSTVSKRPSFCFYCSLLAIFTVLASPCLALAIHYQIYRLWICSRSSDVLRGFAYLLPHVLVPQSFFFVVTVVAVVFIHSFNRHCHVSATSFVHSLLC